MQNDPLEQMINWAKKEYECIRTEPRYMATEYFKILMILVQEREVMMEKLAALERNKGTEHGSDND